MGDLSVRMLVLVMYLFISLDASIRDIRFRIVKNKSYIGLIILATIQQTLLAFVSDFNLEKLLRYLFLISIVIILILLFAVFTDGMGGGDIKYIFCNMLLFHNEDGAVTISSWFLIIFCLLFLYVGIKKMSKKVSEEKGIAMIPFISIASILVFLLNI